MGLWTVGPSIFCTYAQHKKTTHDPVYHALYTSEWQQNAENTLVCSFSPSLPHCQWKIKSFFIFHFPVTMAVKNWKLISRFSVFHAFRMVILGSLLSSTPGLPDIILYNCCTHTCSVAVVRHLDCLAMQAVWLICLCLSAYLSNTLSSIN